MTLLLLMMERVFESQPTVPMLQPNCVKQRETYHDGQQQQPSHAICCAEGRTTSPCISLRKGRVTSEQRHVTDATETTPKEVGLRSGYSQPLSSDWAGSAIDVHLSHCITEG